MERYIVTENLRSPIAETYRKAATNIEFANLDNNIKIIMMTSSLASEGKTTTICNIACVMSELKKKVLLLDLDLRKPAVHKHFRISNKVGLTDLLIQKDDYKNYIYSYNSGLDIITSGKVPANPTEIINSNTLKKLLNDLSPDYDYILIDAPPVILVSDPIILATYSDAVILTVAYSETEKEIAKKAIDSLKQVKANIIGTIVNKMPVTKQNKHYYSYY